MAQTAKSCSQYSHKQQIITQIRTKYTAALAHETNSTSTTKDSPLIVRIPNWIAPSERRRTNGTNQRATNRCVTNHNQRLIESNRGGRTGSARYLLAALDVLDGDELTSPAVAHEAGDAEVAGADVAHELVADSRREEERGRESERGREEERGEGAGSLRPRHRVTEPDKP